MLFKCISLCSSKCHTLLNDIHVDFTAQLHAVLELVLIVALSSLRFNVLLDCVDLALILNQFLLDIIQPVVDFTLQDLVLFGVVLHGVESNLL
jgi:hypothetical protein